MRKSIILSIFIMFTINLTSNVYGADFGGKIDIDDAGILSGLVEIYNNLIDITKGVIKSNLESISKKLSMLLQTMMVLYLVITAGKHLISSNSGGLINDITTKMFLLLILLSLLQFNFYKKYILDNLEILFNNLPTILSSNNYGVVEGILSQTSSLISQIWIEINALSFTASIGGWIFGGIATLSLCLLTCVVILNVLIATLKFYITLGLSGILIVMYFFKITRSYSIGAVKILIESILNITLLSMFLNTFGSVIKKLLVFDSATNFISNCMGILILSFIGVVLIKTLNSIASSITGGAIETGGNLPSLTNGLKNYFQKSK